MQAVQDKPYKELRKLLAVNFMPITEYARRLERSTDYVQARLSAKRAWDMEDVYGTLDIFHKGIEDIPELFPPGGVRTKTRGRGKKT